jgi:hypothetical protein
MTPSIRSSRSIATAADFVMALVLSSFATGCDAPKEGSVEKSIAKAVTVEDPEKTAREALEAKAAAERRGRLDAAKTAARDAEIDAAAILPDVVPTDLEQACDAAVDAYDGFMKGGPEKDALLWYEGRRKKIAERRATCITQKNPSVAACQSVALKAALPSLLELPRADAANMVFARCADKFGKT